MKTTLSLLIVALTMTASQAFAQTGRDVNSGTLRVIVVDESGKPVDAPVYISGTNQTHFLGGANIPGSSTFTMPQGTYKVSSALTTVSKDQYYDRYASHEAMVQVPAGDNVQVTLTLRHLQDATEGLTYAALQQMGFKNGIDNF